MSRRVALQSLLATLVALAQASSEDGPWEGWGTTTQFGSGDGPWGDDPAKQVYITALNNQSLNRMGAAVPWRYYFKWYGSKATQAATVFDSIAGKSSEKACFLMQPVIYGPSNLTGTADGAPTSCVGSSCVDINDDRIAASYQDGTVRQTFPSYLIVPFEGCGGDCKPVPEGPGPDCMNSCAVGSDFLPAVRGQFADTTSSACAAMRVLCGGQADLKPGTSCTWPWDGGVKTNFLKLSRPIGCSPETAWGQQASQMGTHVNWCSGQNMHFDIGMDTPYYQRAGSNAKTTTDAANIVVRYKRVSCAVRGAFDPVDRCKLKAVDCGLHGRCVTDTGVCSCDAGYSGPSCGTAAACQGVTCPINSKCEASTGACVAYVPPSLDGCATARWSCQDPSMASALTSWCSSLLSKQPFVLCMEECGASSDMSVCATCILRVYGLSSSCSWSSGSVTATTAPLVSTTTTSSTSSSSTPVGTVTLRSTSTSSFTRSTVLTTSTSTTATTRSGSFSSSSTSGSASAGSAPSVGGCAAAYWSCQDETIVNAMASWCAGVLNQQPRVSCLAGCASTSSMASCAGCILQLYGYSSSCSWIGAGSGVASTTSAAATTSATSSAATTTTRSRASATTTKRAATTTTTRSATGVTTKAVKVSSVTTTTTRGSTTTSTTANAASTSTTKGAATPAAPRENVDMPDTVRQCPGTQWAPVNDYWSYGQIASAFYEFAVRPWNFPAPQDPAQHVEDCVAALTIVAGECNPGQKPQLGCSASLSGASGVFQTDFLRTMAGYPTEQVMSLCASAFGAGYMAAPFFMDVAGTLASTLSYAGNSPGAFYTCAGAPAFVNNYTACPDPAAQPGVTYSNFIGPFCHKAYSMRWSPCNPQSNCCSLFNGGGNTGQVPFPQYYLSKAAEAEAAVGATFRSICAAAAL